MFEDWAARMNIAASASEKKAIAEEMRERFGVSIGKAYKMLKEGGWESGRKRRRDAGTTSMDEASLKIIAGMCQECTRKNGSQSLPVNVARAIAEENGIPVTVGNSQLRALLRKYNISVTDAKTSTPHQRMRSEYPNQVHCADPSVSLLYYSPNGKQKIIKGSEEYKNKSFLKDKLKCLRYVITDHYSASICVRYYAALGETAENMYDFLLYAWGQKNISSYAFHGLPEQVIWDKGSANIAKSVTNAVAALRVQTNPHLAENPRAKGQVEEANRLVETHFESRLRFEPVHSIEELNEAVERWCVAYNANLIRGEDCRLHRNGNVVGIRLHLWQRIKAEQLRELPDPEICRQIFTRAAEPRKVAGDLAISFSHPKAKRSMRYSLSHLPGILVGQNVTVQPILVDPEPLVIVSYDFNGNPVSQECKPIAYDEAGFDADAPVFGKEYKRQPDTLREQNAKELTALAAGTVPFASITDGKGLKAHSYINASSPFIKQRAGERITVSTPDNVQVHEILISHFEAARQVKARNGWLDDGFISRMKKEYPEGVPSSLVDDIAHDEAGADSAALS
ncbi:MAG: transposase, partial [Treponema sp.]|nr:transposase [Treponema sp.]